MRIGEGLDADTIPRLPKVSTDKISEVLIPVRRLQEFDELEILNEMELVPLLHSYLHAIASPAGERDLKEYSLATVPQLVNLDREQLPDLSEVLPEPSEAVMAVIDGIKGRETHP